MQLDGTCTPMLILQSQLKKKKSHRPFISWVNQLLASKRNRIYFERIRRIDGEASAWGVPCVSDRGEGIPRDLVLHTSMHKCIIYVQAHNMSVCECEVRFEFSYDKTTAHDSQHLHWHVATFAYNTRRVAIHDTNMMYAYHMSSNILLLLYMNSCSRYQFQSKCKSYIILLLLLSDDSLLSVKKKNKKRTSQSIQNTPNSSVPQ